MPDPACVPGLHGGAGELHGGARSYPKAVGGGGGATLSAGVSARVAAASGVMHGTGIAPGVRHLAPISDHL